MSSSSMSSNAGETTLGPYRFPAVRLEPAQRRALAGSL